jgi:hypothetical protein
VPRLQFHTEGPLILGATVRNLVALATWCPEILHSFLVARGADKSLTRPISRCILFDGENISFDARLVIYINSTNIPPIMIINRIYEHQNHLSP